jgi:hypothetical protein
LCSTAVTSELLKPACLLASSLPVTCFQRQVIACHSLFFSTLAAAGCTANILASCCAILLHGGKHVACSALKGAVHQSESLLACLVAWARYPWTSPALIYLSGPVINEVMIGDLQAANPNPVGATGHDTTPHRRHQGRGHQICALASVLCLMVGRNNS